MITKCHSQLGIAHSFDRSLMSSAPMGLGLGLQTRRQMHPIVLATRRMDIAGSASAQRLAHQQPMISITGSSCNDLTKWGSYRNSKMGKQPPYFCIFALPSKADSSSSDFGVISVAKKIRQFYDSINSKNMMQLAEIISEDCTFEDYSFPQPFQGKKEVLSFYQQLASSMGENLKFVTGEICEGDNFIACVDWWFEWKKERVPFTRGFSYFRCSITEGERLVISDVRVVIESPVKPGGVVMAFLKVLTTLFDDFPDLAEWFLQKPHAMLQKLVTIYNLFLAPFLNPVLAFYNTLRKLVLEVISKTVIVLHYIAKARKSNRPTKDDQ